MTNLIIHGASSFIGKSFLKSITSNKYKIIIIARNRSNLDYISQLSINKNITVYKYKNCISELFYLNEKKLFDENIYIDFSWNGVFNDHRNSSDQYTTNIPMTINSISLAKKLNSKHWIGFGSQAEYGNLNKLINEDDNCLPTTHYGKAKYFTSNIAKELCKTLDLEFTWLRLFSSYGPNDNHKWLIHFLIEKMIKNEEVNTTLGDQIWDYLYIDDIIMVLYKLIDSKGIGITNLSSNKEIKIRDLILLIKELTKSKSEINFGAIPYRSDQVMYMQGDNYKLKSKLNWAPKTKLKDGLTEIIKNYRNE